MMTECTTSTVQLQLLPAWRTSGGREAVDLTRALLLREHSIRALMAFPGTALSVVQPGNKVLYIAHWTGCSASAAQPFSVLLESDLYSGKRKCPLKHVMQRTLF